MNSFDRVRYGFCLFGSRVLLGVVNKTDGFVVDRFRVKFFVVSGYTDVRNKLRRGGYAFLAFSRGTVKGGKVWSSVDFGGFR